MRQEECLVIHDTVFITTKENDNDVLLFLEQEYENESLTYPSSPAAFNKKASLWASKVLYCAALFLLHRSDTKKDLTSLFQEYEDTIDMSAILSADLCLRFLPQINLELKRIDPEDPLIRVLENILNAWHYSAIHNNTKPPNIDFNIFFKNNNFTQLYLDRIIENKPLWTRSP